MLYWRNIAATFLNYLKKLKTVTLWLWKTDIIELVLRIAVKTNRRIASVIGIFHLRYVRNTERKKICQKGWKKVLFFIWSSLWRHLFLTTFYCLYFIIHSRLLRLNTARRSGTGLVTVGPAIVKACKSLLFTKEVSDVEIKQWIPIQLLVFAYAENLISKNDCMFFLNVSPGPHEKR